jgi:hypothetical protein
MSGHKSCASRKRVHALNSDYPDLEASLERIRERGFGSAPGRQLAGLHAVSFPILDTQGHALAAITVPYADRLDQVSRHTIADVETVLGQSARELTSSWAEASEPWRRTGQKARPAQPRLRRTRQADALRSRGHRDHAGTPDASGMAQHP